MVCMIKPLFEVYFHNIYYPLLSVGTYRNCLNRTSFPMIITNLDVSLVIRNIGGYVRN